MSSHFLLIIAASATYLTQMKSPCKPTHKYWDFKWQLRGKNLVTDANFTLREDLRSQAALMNEAFERLRKSGFGQVAARLA